ncbi:hypothetical protein CUMW_247090 [Citrus unshiu]|uniref:Chalcone/stilbene synthase C-terminal domain-containing protein n=1 Tax=Citrus unshiu TaxID=55188 RepID=A0A2H5QNN1_CITUN|nr:hypothetical protein CUMW_247090 [Citrus unshiu]
MCWREYGNMGAPSVFFILDEVRRKSIEEMKATTVRDWSAVFWFGFGPGLTVELLCCRDVSLQTFTKLLTTVHEFLCWPYIMVCLLCPYFVGKSSFQCQ